MLYFVGLCIANKKQLKIFYVPEIIEVAFLSIAITLLIFRVPERWCKDSRFIQLYLTSYNIFSIVLINFLFESHNILYLTLKLNSGYLSDEDEWWKVKNIYND